MRDFVMRHAPSIATVIAALETVMCAALWLSFHGGHGVAVGCLAALCTGLAFDSLVLCLGHLLPESVLLPLSHARFAASGIVVPLLLPICFYAIGWEGARMQAVWGATAPLMVLGLVASCRQRLRVVDVAGITRHTTDEATPTWSRVVNAVLPATMVLPLVILGLAMLVSGEGALLLLAGLSMAGFASSALATGNVDLTFVASMVGEVLMVGFLAPLVLAA